MGSAGCASQGEERTIPRTFGLLLGLAVLWLLLSGMLQGLLLGFGAASCTGVWLLARRMDAVDGFVPAPRLKPGAFLAYLGWLAVEVVKSNIDVAKRVLDPRLPIDPVLVRVPAAQRTDLGRTIYANSITLTPGTVSLDVDAEGILVHALTREGADALAEGEMNRRIAALEPAG